MEIPGFRIERLIAEGGTAMVYLAVQESLKRRVALKILRDFDSAEQSYRFLTEGEIIASLRHPNIITIHDIGRAKGIHYIAMEYLEGGSLADRIKKGMKLAAILDLLETIGGCLRVVHDKGIVHRDIKPGNILFLDDLIPKLTDFGIAKDLDLDQDRTLSGNVVGTPTYISPEQAHGKPLDGRSDIYALGIVFFEMLTGFQPYRGASQAETIVAHLTQPVPLLPPKFAVFQELLQRMIAKEPEDRFATAGELISYVKGLRMAERVIVGALPGSTGSWPMHSAISDEPEPVRAPSGAEGFRRGRQSESAPRQAKALLTRWHHAPPAAKIGLLILLASIPAAALLLQNKPDIPLNPEPLRTADRNLPESSGAERALAESDVLAGAVGLPLPPAETVSPAGGKISEAERFSSAAPKSQEQDLQAVTNGMGPGVEKAPQTGDEGGQVQPFPLSAENQPTDAQSPEIADDSAVAELLSAGEAALADYRLITPEKDSATYYYREVLARVPEHSEAKNGLAQVAERYNTLARAAIRKGKYRTARLYIRRGLSVQPRHSELLALKSRIPRRSRPSKSKSPQPQEKADDLGGVFLENF